MGLVAAMSVVYTMICSGKAQPETKREAESAGKNPSSGARYTTCIDRFRVPRREFRRDLSKECEIGKGHGFEGSEITVMFDDFDDVC
jgi:hypothetical protein